jgi:hypothetical protein
MEFHVESNIRLLQPFLFILNFVYIIDISICQQHFSPFPVSNTNTSDSFVRKDCLDITSVITTTPQSSLYMSIIILYAGLFTQLVLQIKYNFRPHKLAGHTAAKGEMRNGYKNFVRKQKRTIRHGRFKRNVLLLTEIIRESIKTTA